MDPELKTLLKEEKVVPNEKSQKKVTPFLSKPDSPLEVKEENVNPLPPMSLGYRPKEKGPGSK